MALRKKQPPITCPSPEVVSVIALRSSLCSQLLKRSTAPRSPPGQLGALLIRLHYQPALVQRAGAGHAGHEVDVDDQPQDPEEAVRDEAGGRAGGEEVRQAPRVI